MDLDSTTLQIGYNKKQGGMLLDKEKSLRIKGMKIQVVGTTVLHENPLN